MRRTRFRRSTVLVVSAVLAAGCSGTDAEVHAGGPDGPGPGPTQGEWVRHRLGAVAADREAIGTRTEQGVAALVVEEPGTVRAWLVHPDGTASESTVDAGESEFRMLTAVTDGPAGLIATGNDWHPTRTDFVLVSIDDGVAWTEQPMTGLDAPIDVADLVSTEDGYVAVGALRTGDDPSSGPFEPVIATSPDGTTWTRADLPATSEGHISSLVAVPDGLLAAGRSGDSPVPVMWRSEDGGTTWAKVPDGPAAEQLAANGPTVFAVTATYPDGAGPTPVHRSDDGGRTWVEGDPELTAGFGFMSFFADPAGFSLVTSRAYQDAFDSPELCYADIDRCGPISGVGDQVVLLSDDARSWRRADLAALPGLFRPGSVVHDDGGNTVILGETDDAGWGAWFWDADQGDLPLVDPASVPDEPVYDGPPMVDHGATLVAGELRGFPLFIHCGMDRLGEFNGVQWGRTDAPDEPTSSTGGSDELPDDWPVVGQHLLGFITLVGEDRIEYSLKDGTVIAVYEPLPADTPRFGCE